MLNPWLDLPLDDYEGHMKSSEVQQLDILSDLFKVALASRSPVSVAILGIAGGNGLDHVDTKITKRIVGLDLNPLYLDAVKQRYSQLPGLELACIDLAEQHIHLKPVDLVHAALIFEHAGIDRCLENAVSLVAQKGALSVVLQLPAETAPEVGTSPFSSMQRLKSHFSLIEPCLLCEILKAHKFRLTSQTHRPLQAGKAFWTGIFIREDTDL